MLRAGLDRGSLCMLQGRPDAYMQPGLHRATWEEEPVVIQEEVSRGHLDGAIWILEGGSELARRKYELSSEMPLPTWCLWVVLLSGRGIAEEAGLGDPELEVSTAAGETLVCQGWSWFVSVSCVNIHRTSL